MHEHSILASLVRKLDDVAKAEGAAKIVGFRVRLGALSHFTPEHFLEHFVVASKGTTAEGARVDAVMMADESDPDAMGVVLESVDLETPTP